MLKSTEDKFPTAGGTLFVLIDGGQSVIRPYIETVYQDVLDAVG